MLDTRKGGLSRALAVFLLALALIGGGSCVDDPRVVGARAGSLTGRASGPAALADSPDAGAVAADGGDADTADPVDALDAPGSADPSDGGAGDRAAVAGAADTAADLDADAGAVPRPVDALDDAAGAAPSADALDDAAGAAPSADALDGALDAAPASDGSPDGAAADDAADVPGTGPGPGGDSGTDGAAGPGPRGCLVPTTNAAGGAGSDCGGPCAADPSPVDAAACRCVAPDVDTDLDGVPDCRDVCPTDPTRAAHGPCGTGPTHVDLTWMTVANIYAELGSLRFIIDGYISRVPSSNFFGGGQGLEFTHQPSLPDVAAVTQVLDALGGPSKVNLLLTGHSHFDHSFDTATWSFLTAAPIIGSRTTCYQAIAQGIPAERCTEVLGGEKITLLDGVTMRVVRWNHSGDSTTNPEQHDPVELGAVPVPDPVTGGLRAGVAEDFPNGGGGRAFLFSIDGADGPYSWFFLNSSSAVDIDVPIVVDGVDYGAPLENLKAAMADAGLASVDLWIGAGGAAVARLVLPIVNPKAYLPVHWDQFKNPFLSRPPVYRDPSLAALLNQQGVNLLVPVEVMDKWRLDRTGVQSISNTALKQALPFQ